MAIHPTAVIHPSVKIGDDVEIGPYTHIEEDVIIEDGAIIDAHVKIGKYTRLGRKCQIYFNAVVGGPPQDHSFDPEVRSYTEIGEKTIIREFVTIHRSPKEEFKTIIGRRCMIMAFVHVAHDSCFGDDIVVVNNCGFAGHCEVGSGAIISGNNNFHQFCRIGELAFVGPGNYFNLDIPPFCLLGYPGYIYGPNTIGLRRAGMKAEQRAAIRKAIKTFFFKGLKKADAIAEIESEEMTAEVKLFIDFIKSSKRGIVPAKPKHLETETEVE